MCDLGAPVIDGNDRLDKLMKPERLTSSTVGSRGTDISEFVTNALATERLRRLNYISIGTISRYSKKCVLHNV